jgi:hypothetical protein
MNVLVVFAHPRLEASVVQRRLLDGIRGLDQITIHDLYLSISKLRSRVSFGTITSSCSMAGPNKRPDAET